VVFLAFWSLQGPLLTWCLGGNGLELVSSSRPVQNNTLGLCSYLPIHVRAPLTPIDVVPVHDGFNLRVSTVKRAVPVPAVSHAALAVRGQIARTPAGPSGPGWRTRTVVLNDNSSPNSRSSFRTLRAGTAGGGSRTRFYWCSNYLMVLRLLS
jgi:hypothetical protein